MLFLSLEISSLIDPSFLLIIFTAREEKIPRIPRARHYLSSFPFLIDRRALGGDLLPSLGGELVS